MTRGTLRAKRIAAAALIGASATLTPITLAAPAQACVWDAAWFFLHQCNEPPPPANPAPAGPPAPLIACDETHCGPDVPIPCYGPGSPC
jgi:hypothetical protein